jgi:hypothetical protein
MKVTTSEMQERIRREVAMPSRLRYAALLTASIIMGAGMVSLLATEPALPERTRYAFAGMLLMAVGWASVAAWVLLRRRVLFGRQRVIASRLACVITVAAFGGSVVVRAHLGMGAVVTSGVLVVVAVALLVGSRRHVRKLDALVRDIDRHVGQPGVAR